MSDFRAIAHTVPPHGVLVRFYSRVSSGWRSLGQLVMPREEWNEFRKTLSGVVVFEGVGRQDRRAE